MAYQNERSSPPAANSKERFIEVDKWQQVPWPDTFWINTVFVTDILPAFLINMYPVDYLSTYFRMLAATKKVMRVLVDFAASRLHDAGSEL